MNALMGCRRPRMVTASPSLECRLLKWGLESWDVMAIAMAKAMEVNTRPAVWAYRWAWNQNGGVWATVGVRERDTVYGQIRGWLAVRKTDIYGKCVSQTWGERGGGEGRYSKGVMPHSPNQEVADEQTIHDMKGVHVPGQAASAC
jgi:hypothetical protein